MKIMNHKKAICFVALLTILICVPAIKAHGEILQKEKKEKKEKPPYNWLNDRPDKLSGMKNLDDYILFCDTVFDRIQTYKDSISFFRLDTLRRTLDDGTKVNVVKIVDDQGNPKSFSTSFKQSSDFIITGLNILSDVTLIAGKNTTAALDLTSNPLAAFTYGKCLKGGPKIAELAYNEVRKIVAAKKEQNAVIKSMKASKMEGSTDQAYIQRVTNDETIDPDTYNIPLSKTDTGSSDGELPAGWDKEEVQ